MSGYYLASVALSKRTPAPAVLAASFVSPEAHGPLESEPVPAQFPKLAAFHGGDSVPSIVQLLLNVSQLLATASYQLLSHMLGSGEIGVKCIDLTLKTAEFRLGAGRLVRPANPFSRSTC